MGKKRGVGQIHGAGRSFLKRAGWMQTPTTGHVDTCSPLPWKPEVSPALGGRGPWVPAGHSVVQAGAPAFSRGPESLEEEGEGRGDGSTGADAPGRGHATYAT